jgi:uncharacterized protein
VPFELPADPHTARRARVSGWISTALVILLGFTVVYLGYIGYAGSAQAVLVSDQSTDCQTPMSAYGWAYQAVNYPEADDQALARLSDRAHCPRRAGTAGTEIVTSDGIRIAAWYIPGPVQLGDRGVTVVIAHDHGGNKSDMLAWARVLHDQYNVVLFDFRAHGQSSGDQSTVGVREQSDLRAVIDWVETTHAPAHLAVLGVSMGGAAAADEATSDPRVGALILDSTYATLANGLQARLEHGGYQLALPGAWAIMLGGLLRTGEDMSAADPVQAVEHLGNRPVLIISAGRDDAVGIGDAESLRAAAEAGGAQVELKICGAAGHADSIIACSTDYAGWVLAFLARAIPAAN